MIVRPFADTNLAVYCLDADPTRRAKALSVMRARPVISVQVVNEFLSVVIRKSRLPRETAMRLTRILMNRCEVVSVTRQTVEMALELGDRYQLSHWDALIVAASLAAGCDTLFSEDLQHGQVFNRQLTVVNPFHS